MWRRAGATGVAGTQMGSAAIKELEAAPEQPYLCPPPVGGWGRGAAVWGR